MHALTQGENTHNEERVAGPAGATPPAMEHAARPRCLFCRYRVPAAAKENSHD